MQKIFFFLVLLFTSFCSCKKTIHENVHENHVVDGNLLPYYNGVSTIKIQSYVNKLYVDLIGREATSVEINNASKFLIDNSFSMQSKDSLVQHLLITDEFYTQFFLKTSGNMLNSTSKNDIADQINFFVYLQNFNLQNQDTVSANALKVENDRLQKLYSADSLFRLHQISINEYYRRFIFNYFYDQINMGAENFVKASFENLFYRMPTTNELNQGVGMVNGLSAYTLFLQSGNSKGDFAYIVTNCNAFYEGLVTTAYSNFMLRKPTDTELNQFVNQLSVSQDYLTVIKKIVISKEYAGF